MDKVQLIQKVILFQGLGNADYHKLAEVATVETLPSGGQVFREGATGDSMFIVSYGTVQVLKEGKEGNEEIARMGAGQHFGEMALIDNERRSATVEAVEHTELVQIKRGDLENLLAQDNALGHRVYKAFAKYLCLRLRQTTSDLTFTREAAKRRGS